MDSKKKKNIIELTRMNVQQFRDMPKMPLCVVADNVRSKNNVGSILRTSDGFALSEVLLCGITPAPPDADIHKTALGAEDSILWSKHPDTIDALNLLKQNGYKLLCLEQTHNSVKLDNFIPDSDCKYALVIGNEVEGVNQHVVDMCDTVLEIPQYGTKHSLNVSVSTGIAIWHIVSKMKIES